jgi:hypothetical protein
LYVISLMQGRSEIASFVIKESQTVSLIRAGVLYNEETRYIAVLGYTRSHSCQHFDRS